jgi:hypothetical protein
MHKKNNKIIKEKCKAVKLLGMLACCKNFSNLFYAKKNKKINQKVSREFSLDNISEFNGLFV